MQKFWRISFGHVAVLLLLCIAAIVGAHTLPISFLSVVPDADYVHLELLINPFELNYFLELDRNQNGRLEPVEWENQETNVTRRILNCLNLRVAGKLVSAEVAGINPDLESHHLTLRAHYRVNALRSPVAIESTLATLTSGSHLTQVTYGKGARIQRARLDMHSNTATFEPFEEGAKQSAANQPQLAAETSSHSVPWFVYAGLVVVVGWLWTTSKHARQNLPANR